MSTIKHKYEGMYWESTGTIVFDFSDLVTLKYHVQGQSHTVRI